VTLTDEQKELFKRWIIENVDDNVVPGDEGDGDALAYNLIQLLYYGNAGKMYSYQSRQDKVIKSWGR
jgi:hypothetical protein